MPSLFGVFTVNGIPRNGATVHVHSVGATYATNPPVKNTAEPASAPLFTGTTGTAAGCDGAYRFTGVANGEYYVACLWNGDILWEYVNVNLGGIGSDILASNYPTLQAAINACPDGGTVVIPRGTYTIDNTYSWTHPTLQAGHANFGQTMFGLVVKGKRVNLRGQGPATILNVAVSNGIGIAFASTGPTDHVVDGCTVSDLTIWCAQPGTFTSTQGVRFDGVQHGNVERVELAFHGDCGVFLTNAPQSRVRNARFTGNANAVRVHSYLAVAGSLFTSGLQWLGGTVMWDGVTSPTPLNGLLDETGLIGPSIDSVWFASLTGAAVKVANANSLQQGSIRGCGWSGNTLDIDLAAAVDVAIENASRVKLRNTQGATLSGFYDTGNSPASSLDVDSSVHGLVLLNTYGDYTGELTGGSHKAIWDAANQGYARYLSGGNQQQLAVPSDDVGVNLLENPGLSNFGNANDSTGGWVLSHFTYDGTVAPHGCVGSFKMNGTAGQLCTAKLPVYGTVPAELKGNLATVSCWVKIDSNSIARYAALGIDDGLGGQLYAFVPLPLCDNTWRRVSATLPVGAGATVLKFLFTVPVASTPNVWFSGVTLGLGSVPLRPAIAPHKLPPLHTRPALAAYRNSDNTSPLVLAVGSTLDPSAAAVYKVRSNAGTLVFGAGVQVFNGSTNWQDGQRVLFLGTDDTNTVDFTTDATINCVLGAASRRLKKYTVLELIYEGVNQVWQETYFKA